MPIENSGSITGFTPERRIDSKKMKVEFVRAKAYKKHENRSESLERIRNECLR